MSTPSIPSDGTDGHGFLTLLGTPWWRLAWGVGAILWCGVLNYFYISGGGENEWLGLASVIPILAYAADVVLRSYRSRRRARTSDTPRE